MINVCLKIHINLTIIFKGNVNQCPKDIDLRAIFRKHFIRKMIK